MAAPVKRRLQILFGMLSAVAGVWALVLIQNVLLERSLGAFAHDKLKENADADGLDISELRSDVVASRTYILAGATTGTVKIFFRQPDPSGNPHFSVLEYYLTHDGERWVESESCLCHDAPCIESAKAAFASN